MKSKNTLLSIILCATFCACAIFIGVWALVYSQNSITSSGQFTFYGIGVNADVTGKIYGYADPTNPVTTNSTQDSNFTTLTPLNFRASSQSSTGCLQDTSSWNNIPLTFSYDGDPITIEITITNKSEVNPLYIKITDKTFGLVEGLTTRIQYCYKTYNNFGNYVRLNSSNSYNSSVTFKIRLSPTGTDAVFGNYNIGIKMSSEYLQPIDSDDVYKETIEVDDNVIMSYPESAIKLSNYFVNAGWFPQRFVCYGDDVPYNAKSTGVYIHLSAVVDDYAGGILPQDKDYEVFYDQNTGRMFAKVDWVTTTLCDDLFSDGTSVIGGEVAWFELEPIKWLVLGYYTKTPDGELKYITEYDDNGIKTITYDYVGRFNEDGTENETFNPKIENVRLNLVSYQVLTCMEYDDNSSMYFNWSESSNVCKWLDSDNTGGSSGYSFVNNAFNTFEDSNGTAFYQLEEGNDNVSYDIDDESVGASYKQNISDINTGSNNYNQSWQKNSYSSVWLQSVDEITCEKSYGASSVSYGYPNLYTTLTDFAIAHGNCKNVATRSAYHKTIGNTVSSYDNTIGYYNIAQKGYHTVNAITCLTTVAVRPAIMLDYVGWFYYHD